MSIIKSLLIADDQPIFRKGLIGLLKNSFTDVKITECHNGAEAYASILKLSPLIAILDIKMSQMNGLDICKEITKQQSATKIIILTADQDKEIIKRASLCGASGYILKNQPAYEIIHCVNKVANGETYFGRVGLSYQTELSVEEKKKQKLIEFLKTLNQAELKTLKLVSENRTSKEISKLLFLTEKTVENYRCRICQKLELPPRNNSLIIWISENKHLLSNISEF